MVHLFFLKKTLFVLFQVQLNDPDPFQWALLYTVAAATSAMQACAHYLGPAALAVLVGGGKLFGYAYYTMTASIRFCISVVIPILLTTVPKAWAHMRLLMLRSTALTMDCDNCTPFTGALTLVGAFTNEEFRETAGLLIIFAFLGINAYLLQSRREQPRKEKSVGRPISGPAIASIIVATPFVLTASWAAWQRLLDSGAVEVAGHCNGSLETLDFRHISRETSATD
jgi:hypothetical protein